MILEESYTLDNGIQIPKLGLGTWCIDDEQVEDVVVSSIQHGYRLIDTAEAYGNERGVGEGIRKSNIKREELFIASKVAAEHKTYDEAKRAIDASLERMKLDYLDQVIIHKTYGVETHWSLDHGRKRRFAILDFQCNAVSYFLTPRQYYKQNTHLTKMFFSSNIRALESVGTSPTNNRWIFV